MCAAAHGWVGLGRIVYVHSSEQLTHWRTGLGLLPSPVRPLPIQQVVPKVMVDGPVDELVDAMHELHARYAQRVR
jgi:tRNA(Arg) A34 adenosine deaminase TadA